jgi:hypothetical protein
VRTSLAAEMPARWLGHRRAYGTARPYGKTCVMIDIDHYPNLALLCWNLAPRSITEAEALALYERNWRLVDVQSMPAHERALVDHLVAEFGNGVLLV